MLARFGRGTGGGIRHFPGVTRMVNVEGGAVYGAYAGQAENELVRSTYHIQVGYELARKER